jgi:hypothetical protein
MKIQNALKSLDHFTRRLCKKPVEEVVEKSSNPVELTEATLLRVALIYFSSKGKKETQKKETLKPFKNVQS